MRIVRLGTNIKIEGTGIENLTTKLIKRDGQAAIYLRDDGNYEVGNIKIKKAAVIFGKKYPTREVYWSNEDFGSIAETTRSLVEADRYFEMFKHRI